MITFKKKSILCGTLLMISSALYTAEDKSSDNTLPSQPLTLHQNKQNIQQADSSLLSAKTKHKMNNIYTCIGSYGINFILQRNFAQSVKKSFAFASDYITEQLLDILCTHKNDAVCTDNIKIETQNANNVFTEREKTEALHTSLHYSCEERGLRCEFFISYKDIEQTCGFIYKHKDNLLLCSSLALSALYFNHSLFKK